MTDITLFKKFFSTNICFHEKYTQTIMESFMAGANITWKLQIQPSLSSNLSIKLS